ncbi:MAG: hypothetical protein GDA52_11785 [Rhodobacteraceae bacterium]|nr:hypothetical protein [Paracoccaceae bacterium]
MTNLIEIRGFVNPDTLTAPADAPAGQGYHLRGFSGNDALTGGAYDDSLDAGPGDDTLNGGGGADTLIGGIGADDINGGAGDDMFGESGGLDDGARDTLDGGSGRDTVDYSNIYWYGINVDLVAGTATYIDGDANTDILRNIEVIIGTDPDAGDPSVANAGDTLSGDDRGNTFRGGLGHDILDGRGGRDWADYTGSDAAVTVNLGATKDSDGFVAASGGHATGDKLKNMEHLIGSEHGDVLTGDGGNNTLRGAAGADTLDGGAGRDRLDYRDSDAGVTVNLATGTGSGGHAAGDVIRNFENIRGSDHDDVLTGNGSKNVFVVGAGNDTIDGGGSNKNVVNYAHADAAVWVDLDDMTGGDAPVSRTDADGFITVRGPGGGDKLKNINGIIGSAFDDALKGHRGFGAEARDVFRGGEGADRIHGRGGRDTADYRDSDEGVTVSLVNGTVNSGGTAQGDRLYSIENVRGSRFADSLTGDDGNNRIRSEGGADTLTGGGDGSDRDTFIFVEDWADDTVITDFELGTDEIKYVGLDLNRVSFANHDDDGDGTNDSVTVTLDGTGPVLLLQGADYDVLMDDGVVGASGLGIFFV